MEPTIQIPSPEALRSLVGTSDGLCVSVHLPLPEHPGFVEMRLVPRQYGAAVDAARKRMQELGVDSTRAEALAAGLARLPVDFSGVPRASRGVAAFASGDDARAFALSVPTREAVHVSRNHHLRPLLQSAHRDRSFRILSLATNRVELFEGDTHGLRLMHRTGVPGSLEEALGSELTDPSLQAHSGPQGSAIFHGSGGADREREIDRERFHLVLLRALQRVWSGREDPLVLAADETHQGRFRKMATLPGLLPRGLPGAAHTSVEDLHARAAAIVSEQRRAEDQAAAAAAADALAHGKAVATAESAAMAALAGRVTRVWVDSRASIPAHVDETLGTLDPAFGDDDVLDQLAEMVITRGGSASVVEPGAIAGSPAVVAELR